MSTAVMMSIRPKWCELIARGRKTIEVRKRRPDLDTPFKCYIYESQGSTDTPWMDEDGHMVFRGRGQVIGEFICDRADRLSSGSIPYDATLVDACLSEKEFYQYAKGGAVWLLHISELVIYDEPREIGEFWRMCPEYDELGPNCWDCENRCGDDEVDCNVDGRLYLSRPPQSWCYVEDLG